MHRSSSSSRYLLLCLSHFPSDRLKSSQLNASVCKLNGADLPSASYDVFPDVTNPLPEPPEIFNNYERQRRKQTLSSCEVSIVLSLTSSLVRPLWLWGGITAIIK